MSLREKFEFIDKHLPNSARSILDGILARFVNQIKSDKADLAIAKVFTEAPERKEQEPIDPKTGKAFLLLAGFATAVFLMAFSFIMLKGKSVSDPKEIVEVGTRSIPAELCNIKGNI